MIGLGGNTDATKTTSYKVVLPFYGYASIAFFIATALLFLSINNIATHYFHPHSLALTHIMALGWGTMMILGASHQLVPVLIEGKLYSNKLAIISFVSAAVGVPLLCYGFYMFDMSWPAKWGGGFVILAIIAYLINVAVSMAKSKHENVHTVFVFTATLWLLITAVVGLILVYNFTYPLIRGSSLHYLPLHAHIGVIGWFLLLIIGVGSRLIPMFLISKYNKPKRLWLIYGLVNVGLVAFIFNFLYANSKLIQMISILTIATAIMLFVNYCYRSYQQRIRKRVDEQMKVSLLSVLMMLIPVVFLFVILVLFFLSDKENTNMIISYGFIIFFGWITAIILGMTFKTLPFIVWNKVYHQLAGKGKTPNPKDLFNNTVFKYMSVTYIFGFTLFIFGILLNNTFILQTAALLLVITSGLYNWNVIKLLLHKPVSI